MNEIKKTLTVIIPCYNEAEIIPEALPEIVRKCEENDWHLIVVDDGSGDHSFELLSHYVSERVKVLHHNLNRGYGAAIKTGIMAANTDYVVTIDCDGQHVPDDIVKLLNRAMQEGADMVVGARPGSSGDFYRGLGKKLIQRITRLLVKISIQDQNSGMKLYDRRLALKVLPLTPDNMAYSDIILLLFVDSRRLVVEEPISIRSRKGGKSTISTWTAVDTLSEIFNLVVLFHPMKIFIPLALFFLLSGLGWTVRGIVLGGVLSTGACFLLLAGMNVFLIGLIIEQFRRLNGR